MESYESAARLNGEIRLYLSTKDRVDLAHLNSLLGYRYSSEREHHADGDPWEWAFGDPRPIGAESDFTDERNRVLRVFLDELRSAWEVEFIYYPVGRSTAHFHWSSGDGWVPPPQLPASAV